ncbi:MAG: photosynthetic complex assembly protein PuhC [Parvularculaceae bacterium]
MSTPDRPQPPHRPVEIMPTPLKVGGGALLAFVVAAAMLSDADKQGDLRHAATPVLEMRSLTFSDAADGGVVVREWDSEATVHTYAPGEGGFVRTALRGLAHSRRMAEIGSEAPFHLKLMEGEMLVLEDVATGKRIGLDAFGDDNRAQFALLLDTDGAPR